MVVHRGACHSLPRNDSIPAESMAGETEPILVRMHATAFMVMAFIAPLHGFLARPARQEMFLRIPPIIFLSPVLWGRMRHGRLPHRQTCAPSQPLPFGSTSESLSHRALVVPKAFSLTAVMLGRGRSPEEGGSAEHSRIDAACR